MGQNTLSRKVSDDELADAVANLLAAGYRLALVAAHDDGDALRIDSWLLSCRIFARSAEPFILRGLIDIAAGMGVTRLLGAYQPTAKNDVVADLYPCLGFVEAGDGLFVRRIDTGTGDLVTHIAVD